MFENLTDNEVAKVEAFMADPILVEAVRKVMLTAMYSNGTLRPGIKADPLKNAAFSLVGKAGIAGVINDLELGQDLRALYTAVGLMESAFNKLSKIKAEPGEDGEEPKNPAL